MKQVLHISDYAKDIYLFDEFAQPILKMNSKEQLVDALLLIISDTSNLDSNYKSKRLLLHGLLNTLPPNTLGDEAINTLNQLLQLELKEKTITLTEDLINKSKLRLGNTKIAVWEGDICTLKTDAIVNAANNQMLGCWQPLHACIDNAIHTAAGVQLRDDCNYIMKKQGFAEPTGTTKITRAYNLPSKYVLHTVGPIVKDKVTEQSKVELASSYTSCLDVCKEVEAIRSIAFCGISTGVFGYPAEQAALVAIDTVKNWLKNNPDCLDLVVFNVFSDNDLKLYDLLINAL